MKFSVIGLPHYTIWHLYEPSVDDIRHMEEMEQERKQKEAEEKQNEEKIAKIKDQFDDASKQWDKDKSDIQNLAKDQSEKKEHAEEQDHERAADHQE